MPLTEHDHYLIEQHLLGRLSGSEQSEFDDRSGDPDFQEELNMQRDIVTALYSSGRDELKAGLQNLEAEIRQQPPAPKIRTMPRWWLAAASIAVLVTLFFWLFSSSPSNQELFAQYFEPYPNVVAPIQKGVPGTDPQKAAYQAYEQKNYEGAIRNFTAMTVASDTSNFYLGLAYLGKGDFKNALQTLEKIEVSSSFKRPAQWYQVLTLLQNDQRDKAKTLLEGIENDGDSPFSAKATELLRSLK